MEIEKATSIIKALSDGIDPYTREQYPSDSPYQMPDTVKALNVVLKALEKHQQSMCGNKTYLVVQGSLGVQKRIVDYSKLLMQKFQ